MRSWQPMARRSSSRCIAAALMALCLPALAANPAFQNYFFQACQSATGALATRCSATPGGLGDLSGDSESSLNPSQNMSHTKSSASLAEVRSAEARGRADVIREGETPAADSAQSVQVGPFSLLVNGRATWFERDRNPDVHQERSLEGDSWALELGFDQRMSERFYLGALAAFESLSYDFAPDRPSGDLVPATHAGTAQTDSKSLTLFAVLNATEHSYVDAAVGYGRQQHDFRRNPVFQDSTRQTQFAARVAGDTESTVFWVALNGGLDFASGATTFGPFAGVTYTRSEIDAYTERDLNGSGLAMSLEACLRKSVLGHAGLRADRAFSTGRGVFVPQLRIEYLHEFRTRPLTQASHYVLDSGASGIRVTGDRPKAGRFSVGAGVTAILPHGWIAFLDVDTLASGDVDRERVTLGVRAEL
ncbi:MAG: autotransporter outer membrane beta-barrel domain-containing protein [Steroidobacteraceae bacterium]|jgi:uncharacterized protein YhjY with autotransporter beta-barrel domain